MASYPYKNTHTGFFPQAKELQQFLYRTCIYKDCLLYRNAFHPSHNRQNDEKDACWRYFRSARCQKREPPVRGDDILGAGREIAAQVRVVDVACHHLADAKFELTVAAEPERQPGGPINDVERTSMYRLERQRAFKGVRLARVFERGRHVDHKGKSPLRD